jgi:hypothetical protein
MWVVDAQELFDRVAAAKEVKEVKLRVGFIEIHKEEIHDLLAPAGAVVTVRENNQRCHIEPMFL